MNNELRLQAEKFIADNLPQLCDDVCRWRDMGELPPDAKICELFAITTKIDATYGIRVAESMITYSAMDEVRKKLHD